MLDEFREDANSSAFFDEEGDEIYEEIGSYQPRGNFLGMTAAQRLVIALMILMMTCIIGGLALLIFDKVVPPPLL